MRSTLHWRVPHDHYIPLDVAVLQALFVTGSAEATRALLDRNTPQTQWARKEDRDPWEEGTVVWWLRQKELLPSTKDTYLKNFLQVRTWSLASPLQQYKKRALKRRRKPTDETSAPVPARDIGLPGAGRQSSSSNEDLAGVEDGVEVVRSSPTNDEGLLVMDQQTLIADWSNKTKASLKRPFRASRYAVIKGSRTKRLVAWVQTLRDTIQWMSAAEAASDSSRQHPISPPTASR